MLRSLIILGLLGAAPALASPLQSRGSPYNQSISSGVVPLGLDGSAHSGVTASSTAVSLTTTTSNDMVMVCATTNGGPIVSVTSPGLTFSHRATFTLTAGQNIEEWDAVAASPLSSASITITNTSFQLLTVDAFGVKGVNTGSPFDGTAVTGSADPLSISTTNANTFIYGCYRMSSVGSPTAGSGWTLISGADFQAAEYKIVSTTQTGLSVTLTTGAGNATGGIADALTQ